MKFVVLISLLLVSCGTNQTATKAENMNGSESAPAESAPTSSLVAGQVWTLEFTDGCKLTGDDVLAKSAHCPDSGKVNLDGDVSQSLGAQVASLKMGGDNPVVGGVPFAKLSHAGATYNIDVGQTAPLLTVVRSEISAHKIAEREKRLQGAEPCSNGEVVVDYDSCPDMGGSSDVCGQPVTVCGPPRKAGENCRFNTSCESGRCSTANICE